MSNKSGVFNVNTGGKVEVSNDPGKTHTAVWREQPLKAWQKKELEMTNRARNFYPNVRESALERELWNQVTGNHRSVTTVNPKLAYDWNLMQSRLQREDRISEQLFNQINAK